MDKTQLRPLVLDVLRRLPETNFDNVEDGIKSITPEYNYTDELALRDVLWELLIQGVLAPGMNDSNLDLPHIHLTDYGKMCVEENSILPHDPDGYLKRLEDLVGYPLDDTALTYIREGLLTFLGGFYFASTVMLGVASERLIDILTQECLNAIADTSQKSEFDEQIHRAGRSVKKQFDVLREELLSLSLPPDLKDALDIQLSGIFTLIRYSRNDAGHPTGRVIDRDMAHANLLLFPQYCKRVNDLIEYFKTHTV